MKKNSEKVMVLGFDVHQVEKLKSIEQYMPKGFEIFELNEFWDGDGEDAAAEFIQFYEDEIDYEVDNDSFDHEFGMERYEDYTRVSGDIAIKFATLEFRFPEGFYEFSAELHYAKVYVKVLNASVERICIEKRGERGSTTMGWVYVWTVKYDYEND